MLQAEEEKARQVAEKECKRQEKEAKKQRRREELGDDYVSEDEEEVEEEEEREGEGDAPPAEKDEKPKGPSSILSTFFDHRDESKFWLSMVSLLTTYMYMYICNVIHTLVLYVCTGVRSLLYTHMRLAFIYFLRCLVLMDL